MIKFEKVAGLVAIVAAEALTGVIQLVVRSDLWREQQSSLQIQQF